MLFFWCPCHRIDPEVFIDVMRWYLFISVMNVCTSGIINVIVFLHILVMVLMEHIMLWLMVDNVRLLMYTEVLTMSHFAVVCNVEVLSFIVCLRFFMVVFLFLDLITLVVRAMQLELGLHLVHIV